MLDTFRLVMNGVVMPVISLVGLVGNVTSICVLRHPDIQMKKYMVDLLSALACFDILFLLTNFILITFPHWVILEHNPVWEGTGKKLYLNIFTQHYFPTQEHGTLTQSSSLFFIRPITSSWLHQFTWLPLWRWTDAWILRCYEGTCLLLCAVFSTLALLRLSRFSSLWQSPCCPTGLSSR